MFSFKVFVQPEEKKSPGKSTLSQATLGAQGEDSPLYSPSPSFQLSPISTAPVCLQAKPSRNSPCHHLPRHYQGTFLKEWEGRLPEFPGNVLRRAFHL